MTNEYKISLLRGFGTEQMSITATLNVEPKNMKEAGEKALDDFDSLMETAFYKTSDRRERELKYTVALINEKKEKFRKELIDSGKTEKQADYEVLKAFGGVEDKMK